MKIKILVILCIFAYSVKAENIHGRIFSNKGVAIEYANVVVLDSNDSTYINGTVTITDFTLHFSCCFTKLLHSLFITLLNNFTM